MIRILTDLILFYFVAAGFKTIAPSFKSKAERDKSFREMKDSINLSDFPCIHTPLVMLCHIIFKLKERKQ